MASRAFETFVAPARARPALWRLILGLALAVAVYAAIVALIFAAVWLLVVREPATASFEILLGGDTPLSMLTVLATFSGMAAGVMLSARYLQKRRPGTLFGPRVRTLRHFVIASGTVLALLALSVGGWALFADPLPGLPLSTWLALLPFALLGVLVQTGAEELFFRGYLQQQLAARFASPLVWAVVPSTLFALAHFSPATTGANAWLVVAATGIFGLLAADLTARTGSIGAAWGFHFANNVTALLLVATEGTLTGLALFRTPYSADDATTMPLVLPLDMAIMILGWLLVRRFVTVR